MLPNLHNIASCSHNSILRFPFSARPNRAERLARLRLLAAERVSSADGRAALDAALRQVLPEFCTAHEEQLQKGGGFHSRWWDDGGSGARHEERKNGEDQDADHYV